MPSRVACRAILSVTFALQYIAEKQNTKRVRICDGIDVTTFCAEFVSRDFPQARFLRNILVAYTGTPPPTWFSALEDQDTTTAFLRLLTEMIWRGNTYTEYMRLEPIYLYSFLAIGYAIMWLCGISSP